MESIEGHGDSETVGFHCPLQEAGTPAKGGFGNSVLRENAVDSDVSGSFGEQNAPYTRVHSVPPLNKKIKNWPCAAQVSGLA